MRIGIALFEGAEELDWAGPWEVFAMWSRQWPEDDVSVLTISEHAGPIRCAKGLRVLADTTWSANPSLDLLIYPGGEGTRQQWSTPSPVHDRLAAYAQAGTLLASVCTGSLVLAAAGLLRGRPATTHWRWLQTLRSLDASVDVRAGDRFVDAGSVVTSAGVSAGIDMALYLVGRLCSEERARDVRRAIQYDPAPPI